MSDTPTKYPADYLSATLIDSNSSDVQQFLEQWAANTKTDPAHYPKELTKDEWIVQFWAWMEWS